MSSVGQDRTSNEGGPGVRFTVSSRFEEEYWRYAVQELMDVGHWMDYPRDFRSDEGEKYWTPRYEAALELAELLAAIWNTDRSSDGHPTASPLWIAVRRQLLVAVDWHGVFAYRAERVVKAVPERLPPVRPSAIRAFLGSLLDELFALGARHPHPDDQVWEERRFPVAWRLLEDLRANLAEVSSDTSQERSPSDDGKGAIFLIRTPLDVEMVLRYEGSELPAAITAVSQMRRLWSALFGHWGMSFARSAADEQLWQTLRHDVLFLLNRRETWADVRRQADELLPEQLLEADFLIALDQDIQADFDQRFQATETLLIRQAIAEGQWPGSRDEGDLFTLFEPMLAWMETTYQAAVARKVRALGLTGRKPGPSAPGSTERNRVPRKSNEGGSPPKLTPERFASEYWAMADDYARSGDRRPTQPELASRLTEAGFPMAARTIRQYRANNGLSWPPARPLDVAV